MLAFAHLGLAPAADSAGSEWGPWVFPASGLVSAAAGGMHFAGSGAGAAYAPWGVGSQPFALTWDLEVDKGAAAPWRWPGVAVALTTARPDQMGPRDVSVLIGTHLEGLFADVRQGPLLAVNTNTTGWPPAFSQMADRSLAKRFELNQGGAGGRWYSVEWPNVDLAGAHLAFRMARTPSNTLQFAVYHAELDDGRSPWWSKEWSLPPAVASADFRYVVVRTTINPEDFRTPGQPPRGGVLTGWIRNLDGSAGPAAMAWPGGLTNAVRPALQDHGTHPGLYFRASDLPALRRKFNDPMFAGYRALILQNAADVPAGGVDTEKSGRGGIADLTWAYVFTGEDSYKVRLLPLLEAEARSLAHEQFRMMAAHDMAVAYDVLFAELPEGLRGRMQRYLGRAALVYVRNVRKGDWWYGGPANRSNTVPIGGAGGGAAGLALMDASPIAREAAALAGPTTRQWYQALSDDGGCVEGTLYWNYGLTAYLRLGHMLKNAAGSDGGLLDTPALRKNVRFVETQLGGDRQFFTFNDTQPWLTGLAVCADLGSRFDQPLMLWMADTMAAVLPREAARPDEVSRGDVVPYAFLWRSATPAPAAFPGVPTVAALETLQWGVLRSDRTFQPGLVVGLKGRGGLMTHHVQADQGSFVLQAGGEAFLIDPGYYQPDAEAHSLPMVNGRGPDPKGTARLVDAWERERTRGMTVDATAAFKGVDRVRRHVVMVDDKAVVILDDILASGKVTTHFQCGFPATLGADRKSVTIAGTRGVLALRVYGPAGDLAVQGPRDFGKSWIFRRRGVAWYTVSGEYKAGEPLMTVLAMEPVAISVARATDAWTVSVEGRPAVRFVREGGGWKGGGLRW